MRKAFTLIELLVVMVMVTMLAVLLLPANARMTDEAKKAQCRVNLMRIGQAIVMYANANDGYVPEISGPLYLDAEQPDQLRYPFPVTSTKAQLPEFRHPFGGGSIGADGECLGTVASNSVTIAHSQWWHATSAQPARATGLGLLWAGGYLTGAGAKILYCPGNASSNVVKEKGNDKKCAYDADEPFWTSKGAVARANNNMVGEWNWTGQTVYGREGCFDGTDALDRGECLIIINYSLRFPQDMLKPLTPTPKRPQDGLRPGSFHTNSYKLSGFGGRGILADHTEPFLAMSRFQLGNNNWKPSTQECYEKITPMIIRNHDAAWNVLFADGSVKTYSDTSGAVRKAMALWWKSASYNFPEESVRKSVAWEDKDVWAPYFDKAHSDE